MARNGRRFAVTLFAVLAVSQTEGSGLAAAGDLTFRRDIAPLIFEKCVACHRPEGGAPFNLLTYEDVRRRATLIAGVTRTRYMPPWKPEPDSGPFEGERRLSAADRRHSGLGGAGLSGRRFSGAEHRIGRREVAAGTTRSSSSRPRKITCCLPTARTCFARS